MASKRPSKELHPLSSSSLGIFLSLKLLLSCRCCHRRTPTTAAALTRTPAAAPVDAHHTENTRLGICLFEDEDEDEGIYTPLANSCRGKLAEELNKRESSPLNDLSEAVAERDGQRRNEVGPGSFTWKDLSE
ncbi:hypothetical protein VE04_07861 [Pseudogymnoascus sp. 24MN13]|nr:hypothetical protein VE04_07861 [Pseudogymnoascus sp. 24MN13]